VHDTVASIWVNDKDANGYSLHTSLCGWPGVITKLLGRLGFTWLACMIRLLGNVIPKNASGLYSQCE
jgi:hypothetical protein